MHHKILLGRCEASACLDVTRHKYYGLERTLRLDFLITFQEEIKMELLEQFAMKLQEEIPIELIEEFMMELLGEFLVKFLERNSQ